MNPNLGAEVFVAPGARIIGEVSIGAYSSIWFNAVLRGDVHRIEVGERSNIQDNATVHVTHERFGSRIGDEVTVGHGATLHGCQIADRCLIGMGATILDGAVIADDCLVAAGALVTPGKTFPSRSLIVGSPAKVARSLNEAEVEALKKSADHYIKLAARHRHGGA